MTTPRGKSGPHICPVPGCGALALWIYGDDIIGNYQGGVAQKVLIRSLEGKLAAKCMVCGTKDYFPTGKAFALWVRSIQSVKNLARP